jgi:pyruvate-formate lyase-activating enzyme
VLDYDEVVARFDTMMDWLAKTYIDALNVIHYMHDKYAYERLAFARRLAARHQLVWVRFVLVPGWTDDPGNVAALARFTASLGNVERVDVLPFHTLGAPKYAALGLDDPCAGVTPPAAAQARAVFTAAGLPTV